MEKKVYLLRDYYDNMINILKLSDEQVRFFDWLCEECIINNEQFSLEDMPVDEDIEEI